MRFVYIISGVIVLAIVLFLTLKTVQVNKGKAQAEQEISKAGFKKFPNLGAVKSLSVIPLVDYYSRNGDLKTEPGVSYLIKADDTVILMDVGANMKKEHPSPLLCNMEKLGIRPADIDMIFFSHLHMDHVGGMKEQKNGTFSLSQGKVEIGRIPVFAPGALVPSAWNQGPEVRVVQAPEVLKPGIASTGVIPRFLFIMGNSPEQSLVVNVKGKGLVVIIGCGHPTIERIIKRVKMISGERIYAVIGGLHFPVNGGRVMLGPINVQKLVGSDAPPWRGLGGKDVLSAVDALKKLNPALVALSPHDSSDWSLAEFREAFGTSYREVKVGQEIKI